MAPIKEMSAALRALLTVGCMRRILPAAWVSRLTMEPIQWAFWDPIGQEQVLRWVDDQGDHWLAVHRWGTRLPSRDISNEARWYRDAP